ncbi:MAG: oligosaccharide flippase family protein, partial [Candidatus Eremiobacteraeota bacterium]|nr:oligosaccharide flippase family protein [Candidatus Eremiobacteraeota bacterium]
MAATPRRGVARLVAHTLVTICLGIGAQVATGIVTARVFGPAGKGVISYAAVLANFAVAAAEGLRNGIVFEAGTQDNPLGRVWRTALPLVALFAPAGALVFFLLWRSQPTQIAFLFVALVFPFALFLQAITGVYVVRHEIERLNVQNAWTVGAGSSLMMLVAVAFFHATLVVALCIWLAGFVAAAAWAAVGARSLLAGDRQPDGPSSARRQLAFGLKGALSACVTLLAVRVDMLLVGALLAPSALGIYAIAVALGELPWVVSRAVTWSTTARIGTEDFASAAALTAKVVRFLLTFQVVAALAIVASASFLVPLVYGARFAGVTPLVYVLVPRMIGYGADGVLSYFIAVRAGHPGTLLTFEIGTFVLCAALAAAGIHRFGLFGAALGTTVAFIIAVAAKLTYFCRLTHLGPADILRVRRGDVPDSISAKLPRFVRAVIEPVG